MDQIVIKQSCLTITLETSEEDQHSSDLITLLVDSIAKYKITKIILDLKYTGDRYSSLMIGTIAGVCNQLLKKNICVEIINSPCLTEVLSSYKAVVDLLTKMGVKITERRFL